MGLVLGFDIYILYIKRGCELCKERKEGDEHRDGSLLQHICELSHLLKFGCNMLLKKYAIG